ncbi:hypothetical protein [Solirubrobacter deserti]|uniref:Uncharacterized protein n=1 Tax=Solirubrobacter deserti TaxID=2282478 RepID=A0ABT4RJA5_9ACTN|nr:hypothetical protein [Solirubrobacter deserti]MDA0138624.1 hypothetical protein [Solirubrobacter deserti]
MAAHQVGCAGAVAGEDQVPELEVLLEVGRADGAGAADPALYGAAN